MTTQSPQTSRKPLFSVRFRDGHTVITTADNSVKAEQKALRTRPGFIETIRIIKGKRDA
ncbi:hypothetical protein ACQZ4X_23715 [Agrobacterium vitis]